MNLDIFLIGLAGVTFVAVLIYIATSKKKTEEKRRDPDAAKSSLATDGPTGDLEDRK